MLSLLTSISFFLIPVEIDFRAIPKCEQYNPRLADEGCPKGGGGNLSLPQMKNPLKAGPEGPFYNGPRGEGCKGSGGGNCGIGKGNGGGNGTGNEGKGRNKSWPK